MTEYGQHVTERPMRTRSAGKPLNHSLPADYEPAAVRAVVIPSRGRWEIRWISTSLGAYQRIIGGYVAIYRPHREWHLYCHEVTGMTERSRVPQNTLATALARQADPGFGVAIQGSAVVVGTGPLGQDVDIPDEVLCWLEGLDQGS